MDYKWFEVWDKAENFVWDSGTYSTDTGKSWTFGTSNVKQNYMRVQTRKNVLNENDKKTNTIDLLVFLIFDLKYSFHGPWGPRSQTDIQQTEYLCWLFLALMVSKGTIQASSLQWQKFNHNIFLNRIFHEFCLINIIEDFAEQMKLMT